MKTRVLLKREQQFNSVLDVKVKEQTQEIRAANLEVINKLAKVSEYKDQVTGDHILRVRSYTEVLAQNVGFREENVEKIGIASIMHDVGKISIPDAIIQKPTKLTPDERIIMEKSFLAIHSILVLPRKLQVGIMKNGTDLVIPESWWVKIFLLKRGLSPLQMFLTLCCRHEAIKKLLHLIRLSRF